MIIQGELSSKFNSILSTNAHTHRASRYWTCSKFGSKSGLQREETCGRQCALSSTECASECVQKREGYTSSCASCFGGVFGCTREHCKLKCISDSVTDSTSLISLNFWAIELSALRDTPHSSTWAVDIVLFFTRALIKSWSLFGCMLTKAYLAYTPMPQHVTLIHRQIWILDCMHQNDPECTAPEVWRFGRATLRWADSSMQTVREGCRLRRQLQHLQWLHPTQHCVCGYQGYQLHWCCRSTGERLLRGFSQGAGAPGPNLANTVNHGSSHLFWSLHTLEWLECSRRRS